MPLKRAARGLLPLLEAAHAVVQEKPAIGESSPDMEMSLVKNAKKIALLTLGVAHQRYGAALEQQQEIVMNISDIVMQVLAMESSLLRRRKLAGDRGANAADACAAYFAGRADPDRACFANRNERLRRRRGVAREAFSLTHLRQS
jgi:hypothetical protein